MRRLTMMRDGTRWAVIHDGGQAGTVTTLGTRTGRMWMARDATGTREGVFPTRRAAAEWLLHMVVAA